MNTVAIIPAAGAGVRMGTDRAKQFLALKDRPLLGVTLERFQSCPSIDSIILVVPAGDLEYCKNDIVEKYHLSKVEKIVPGGERRQDSVRLGIEASGGKYSIVLIHDGVRPFVDHSIIEVFANNRQLITSRVYPTKVDSKEVYVFSEGGDAWAHVIHAWDMKKAGVVK